MNATEHFRGALRAAGLDYAGPIMADGKLHRFRAEGDHNRNAWYVLHAGPPAAGAFGCWKRDIKETWCDRKQQVSQAGWEQIRRHWQEAERERERADIERRAKARKIAARIWEWATPCVENKFVCEDCDAEFVGDDGGVPIYECGDCGTKFTSDRSADGSSNRCPNCNRFGSKLSDLGCPECGESELQPTLHPYLAAKNVQPHGGIRQWRGLLVVPLRDSAGKLNSLQFIAPDNRFDGERNKTFLGGGRTVGCFFTVSDKTDSPLVIAEGFATAASIAEATGHATVAAMNAGNLLAVAKALREKFPAREIIIAADNDQFTNANPGLTKATEAALTIGAKLAVPMFGNTTTKPTDFNDLHKLEGLDAVKTQIESAPMPTESDDERFQRLAKLTPAEYDRVRDEEARQAGVRVVTLDSEVAKHRPKDQPADTVQGSKVSFPELEPWPQAVNGAELLNEIAATAKRFAVARISAIVAASLFVLHTYAFDLGDISPILFITGPTKRCGKSKFLAILLRLVFRPFAAASATAAGIYRVIELYHPTLGVDEVDAFVAGDDQLRGLINSGHTRDAAFHLGCATTADKEYEPRRWSTWTPKIFSGIGRLADTIEDRSIIIKMVRRRKDEPSERLGHGMRFEDVRRKALRFVNDNAEAIRNANPSLPDALNDRAADNWLPLLTLADLAGGQWPAMARQAAIELSVGDDGESLGLNGQLLADIRDVFAAAAVDKLASKDMAERLAQIEGRPWADYGKHRRPISSNQVANLLRGFGVSSRTVRIGDSTAKGYDVLDFSDAFSRYLPKEGLPKSNNVTSPENIGESPDLCKVTIEGCDVSENRVLANKDAGCDVVTFQNTKMEEMIL